MNPEEQADSQARVERYFWWGLVVAALLSRLVWVIWVHPAHEHVFSDMARYVERAERLATRGFETGVRKLAWQTWGTHYLLSIPVAVFGKGLGFKIASVIWGLFSAGTVMMSYRLAKEVLGGVGRQLWWPRAVGIIALFWYPHMSLGGYFLCEPPFTLLQVATTYGFVRVLREGGDRRAFAYGCLAAVAFALRPQIAVFYVVVVASWGLSRARYPRVGPRQVTLIAVPIVLMLLFSMWRFHNHTGRWLGVAENANMNFTAARCHNIVTQAFKNEALLARSNRKKTSRDGRRVSLPGYRRLAKLPKHHPWALRPAFKSDTIKFVGYIGDPVAHKGIRSQCYEKTGWVRQLHYSLQNVSLLWFVSPQWPDNSDGKVKNKTKARRLRKAANAYRFIYIALFWLPSLFGIGLALRKWREDLPLAWVGAQMVVSLAVASWFFGTVRLRTPYDPFAFILTLYSVRWLITRLRRPGNKDA